MLFSGLYSRKETVTAEPGYTTKSGRLAFVNLAEAYRREGLLDDAVRILREGLEREPELLAGRLALGRLLLERGATEEARAEALRIEALAPGAPEGLELRAELLLQQRANMRSAVPAEEAPQDQSAPGPPLASPTLAALYLSQGYVDRARAIVGRRPASKEAPAAEMLGKLEALGRAARRRRMERGR